MLFKDRYQSGQKLADKLESKYSRANVVIIGLPRGGVASAQPVAERLKAPLGLVAVRKVGHPESPEFAIAAVAADGCLMLGPEAKRIDQNWLKHALVKEHQEAVRRKFLYQKPNQVSVKDKTVILIDDGLAAGITMRLAIHEVRHEKPQKIIVAVPVAPIDVVHELQKEVDEVVVLDSPAGFNSIGFYYESFPQLDDEQVLALLQIKKSS